MKNFQQKGEKNQKSVLHWTRMQNLCQWERIQLKGWSMWLY
uniref:Uncharacterized protein n=1 Tax=Rhizophora mucronata TaxID=61149 RepID=A0A2P2NAX0_RHIMU